MRSTWKVPRSCNVPVPCGGTILILSEAAWERIRWNQPGGGINPGNRYHRAVAAADYHAGIGLVCPPLPAGASHGWKDPDAHRWIAE